MLEDLLDVVPSVTCASSGVVVRCFPTRLESSQGWPPRRHSGAAPTAHLMEPKQGIDAPGIDQLPPAQATKGNIRDTSPNPTDQPDDHAG